MIILLVYFINTMNQNIQMNINLEAKLKDINKDINKDIKKAKNEKKKINEKLQQLYELKKNNENSLNIVNKNKISCTCNNSVDNSDNESVSSKSVNNNNDNENESFDSSDNSVTSNSVSSDDLSSTNATTNSNNDLEDLEYNIQKKIKEIDNDILNIAYTEEECTDIHNELVNAYTNLKDTHDNVSQLEVANILGCEQSTISSWVTKDEIKSDNCLFKTDYTMDIFLRKYITTLSFDDLITQSKTKKMQYDSVIIGQDLKIYWEGDKTYYLAKVLSKKNKYECKVKYYADQTTEDINLNKSLIII